MLCIVWIDMGMAVNENQHMKLKSVHKSRAIFISS